VGERTAEVGLLRALGASRQQIMELFLVEAVILAGAGGLGGLLLGGLGAGLLGIAIPGLPIQLAWGFAGLALLVAVLIGLVAGVWPALRAASMDPVTALRGE
jgi:putative ABC transport system permease protein